LTGVVVFVLPRLGIPGPGHPPDHEARAHHQALARHMAREVDLLRALDHPEPAVAA
jgi:hypothetical protein